MAVPELETLGLKFKGMYFITIFNSLKKPQTP
jgi:hypothetical protein